MVVIWAVDDEGWEILNGWQYMRKNQLIRPLLQKKCIVYRNEQDCGRKYGLNTR